MQKGERTFLGNFGETYKTNGCGTKSASCKVAIAERLVFCAVGIMSISEKTKNSTVRVRERWRFMRSRYTFP